ncbi:cupin domain-containing protein [uncultured Roseovarius sp.]|uniref:cupin domain-containing protein n=1 Tax=uncultured Roseovarius sp. TaxID=293344 RepID=UPI0026225118|nr:cupin domain-containing protein [uncultured Roseovarius sp.]
MAMFDNNTQDIEEWRPGVRTRMRVSSVNGAYQLCIFDQYCDPGLGAPLHLHAVEEVLEVMQGQAEIWCGDDTHFATDNQSVLIPAGCKHGFRNTGEGVLHMRATLAAPIFEASYEDREELSRRYVRT